MELVFVGKNCVTRIFFRIEFLKTASDGEKRFLYLYSTHEKLQT